MTVACAGPRGRRAGNEVSSRPDDRRWGSGPEQLRLRRGELGFGQHALLPQRDELLQVRGDVVAAPGRGRRGGRGVGGGRRRLLRRVLLIPLPLRWVLVVPTAAVLRPASR